MSVETSILPSGVKALSVSELTGMIRQLLEDAFPTVWVAGEVSNLSRPSSGHMYLTLKDNQAQIRAVLWRSVASRVPFQPTDGLEVIARGRIGIYAPRGEYQLVIDELQPKGIGALELAFRQLREKLDKLGFFAHERKKIPPRIPRRIALVTSPSGAAIQDLLRIIPRRWPAAEIWICPVRVQGEGAAEEIAAAIALLNQLRCVDVMIVGRGGGSLEDLWAFNEEVVARAIFESQIPIFSAVGHEIDVTIADLVADVRAATPSEAAERVVPDSQEVGKALEATANRLRRRLIERLESVRQRLDDLSQRRVFRQPLGQVQELTQTLGVWADRSKRAFRLYLDRARQQVEKESARLHNLSPLNVLGRGYSLTRKESDHSLVRSAGEVQIGDRIVTLLHQGQLVSRVEKTESERPDHA